MPEQSYCRLPLYDATGDIRAYTLLDPEDHKRFSGMSWHLARSGYVSRSVKSQGNRSTIYLHRAVLGLEQGDGKFADHINRDRLDNRSANLRVVTPGESVQNTGGVKGGSSSYRGVKRHGGRWQASAGLNGQRIHLGLFGNEIDAAATAAQWRHKNLPFAVEDPDLLAHAPSRDKPKHHRASLTDEQAHEIRRVFLSGASAAKAGRSVGTTPAIAYGILRGRSYKEDSLFEEAVKEWQVRRDNRHRNS